MNVLGIETSCDETSAAIVAGGRIVRSNIVFSQTEFHRPYGGVVPEIASRNHLEYLPGIIEKALTNAGLKWGQIDAVAATYGPGLASSLLVGLTFARALALRLKVRLIAINHLEAHLYAPFLSKAVPDMNRLCPMVALIVSGGHTCLVRVDGLGKYHLLGTTFDDAAGEAFDKGAKLLGLGYPGGPEISRLAGGGKTDAIAFPRGRHAAGANLNGLAGELCFSFSGLKTALMYFLKTSARSGAEQSPADIAASYQEAIIDSLLERLTLATRSARANCVTVVGGVSVNARLREKIAACGAGAGIRVVFAEPQYCLDNAAMVAGLAGMGQGLGGDEAWGVDVSPNLGIGDFKLPDQEIKKN